MRMDTHLKEETIDDICLFVKKHLELGSTVESIANAMLGNHKGELVIAKFYGSTLIALSDEEQLIILREYINDSVE